MLGGPLTRIEGIVMSDTPPPTGPDLQVGIAEEDLADGHMLVGHVGKHAVLIARRGADHFAIDATCTHYGGPLGEGLLVGDTVRCPWHHSCFSLRSGEALTAPALSPVRCWRVERDSGRIRVRERVTAPERGGASKPRAAAGAERVVIVGGGAAGFAAAEVLRREGFDGAVTIISADESGPYDRPNLSKDYLAGNAPEDVYRCIAAGIGGTAMPTWRNVLPESDLWALVHYVRDLVGLL